MACHPRRPVRGTLLAFLITALVSILATGCGSGDTNSSQGTVPRNAGAIETDDTAQPGGKIVYGLIAETNGWNPGSSQWAASGLEVAHTIFDTLSAFDAELNIQPFAAESFTPSADYKTWVIKLRPGMTFHNGEPVNADAVRRGFEYLKNSTLTHDAFEPVESFETRSELELVVNMKQPWANYPNALATQIGVITEPDWLTSGDVRNPIGSGPFIFDSWEPNASLRVRKNANYWQRGFPLLDEIEFRVIPDAGTRSQSLEAGTIDIMQMSDPPYIRRFLEQAGSGRYQVFSDTKGETAEVFVQLNTTEPPFDDPDARRALAYATNKQELVDTIAGGLFTTANGPFPPSSPWYTETDYPQYDEAKAKELIERVKARNGGKFEFTLIGSVTPGTLEHMQFLKQRWEDLGISVKLDTLQPVSYTHL
ncbi:MAG: ABC transporter substrate-binding protein, partial [Acidimicrobiales bacterium]|nr:ABC transporter substrate-binding protein [Acidimicrobiales bacterium]